MKERFENVIQLRSGAHGKSLEKVYICGTPKFNQSMSLELEVLNIPPQKYAIL